jgi:hypothetical protein
VACSWSLTGYTGVLSSNMVAVGPTIVGVEMLPDGWAMLMIFIASSVVALVAVAVAVAVAGAKEGYFGM